MLILLRVGVANLMIALIVLKWILVLLLLTMQMRILYRRGSNNVRCNYGWVILVEGLLLLLLMMMLRLIELYLINKLVQLSVDLLVYLVVE